MSKVFAVWRSIFQQNQWKSSGLYAWSISSTAVGPTWQIFLSSFVNVQSFILAAQARDCLEHHRGQAK